MMYEIMFKMIFFVPTHFINNEVLNKTRNLWTSKEKEKNAKEF